MAFDTIFDRIRLRYPSEVIGPLFIQAVVDHCSDCSRARCVGDMTTFCLPENFFSCKKTIGRNNRAVRTQRFKDHSWQPFVNRS